VWRRSDPRSGEHRPPLPPPRDIETLESVVAALDASVSTPLQAHVAVVRTITETNGLDYGAVWAPTGRRAFTLAYETGPLAPAISAAWQRDLPLTESAGMGGKALRERRTVHMDTAPAGRGSCLRWENAWAAGAREGCFIPAVDGGG
jgi:hypothetical protein